MLPYALVANKPLVLRSQTRTISESEMKFKWVSTDPLETDFKDMLDSAEMPVLLTFRNEDKKEEAQQVTHKLKKK
jgi:hypothetical protein